MTVLTWLIWALAHLANPRPYTGVHASTATATRPRRYQAHHAATRKRDNA